MHFPRDIFTLVGVGMVAVLANELETGITFNDKMTLMMVSQLFLALTHIATGVAGQITCYTIISTFSFYVTEVSILTRANRRDWMTTMITCENHSLHSSRGFTDTGVQFPS